MISNNKNIIVGNTEQVLKYNEEHQVDAIFSKCALGVLDFICNICNPTIIVKGDQGKCYHFKLKHENWM